MLAHQPEAFRCGQHQPNQAHRQPGYSDKEPRNTARQLKLLSGKDAAQWKYETCLVRFKTSGAHDLDKHAEVPHVQLPIQVSIRDR